jgi:hypothetical protein
MSTRRLTFPLSRLSARRHASYISPRLPAPARQLIGLLEQHGRDFSSCSLAFDQWCTRNIRPWFDDHVYWDTDLIRRWSGQDVDLTRPLPPDLVIAAAQADPGLIKVIGPYQAMLALPASLDAVQARARAIYASGWRPPIPPGPTRRELADLVTAAASSRNRPAGAAALPAARARRRHADLGEPQLASARGRLTAGRRHPARRRHPDGTQEHASLAVEPGARVPGESAVWPAGRVACLPAVSTRRGGRG